MTDHGSSQPPTDQPDRAPSGVMHPSISIGDLAKQLDALRAEVAALKADFADAKREGAEQVHGLTLDIGHARSYTEDLNQRRVDNIDELTGAIRAVKDDFWALHLSVDRKLQDIERQFRRV